MAIKNFTVLFLSLVLLCSCGYYNPNAWDGESKKIYMNIWKNRTNVLHLNMDIHQQFNGWLQRNGSLSLCRTIEGSDYYIGGEIKSLNLPSLSYTSNETTKEATVNLQVRYIIKESKTDRIVQEVSSQTYHENYFIEDTIAATQDNRDEALQEIVEELSQNLYRVLIRDINRKQ